MTWSRSVSCSVISLALGVAACRTGPDVQVLGDSVRLKRGAASPEQSALFDGKKVDLRGVRGETLGLSVRLGGGDSRAVRLELPRAPASVEAFEVRSLEVSEPSTSMYGSSEGRGTYPDILLPASGDVRTAELAFFDVKIALDAVPGRYAGNLMLGSRAIDVVLTVDRAAIDLEPEPLVWVFYLPKEIARVHGIADVDGPRLLELERQYYELFRAHGALLAADLRPDRFPARRQFVRNVRYWPVAVDASNDAAIARDVEAWLELFAESSVTPFAIPVDEPHSDAEKARARHVAEVIGRAGGRAPRFLRAVTAAPSPSFGDAFDVFFAPTDRVPPRSERTQPIFTYNGRPPSAGSLVLDTNGAALRSWGWIAYRYEIGLWYAWEGLYFSDRYNRGGPTHVMSDPVTFDERSKGGSDWGNGDGVLAYPGPLPSLRLKALRRGLQDRLLLRKLEACGAGDEARKIAARVVPRALSEAEGEPSWPAEEPAWERARRELLDQIEVHCETAAKLAG
jgi:hypothetical protein